MTRQLEAVYERGVLRPLEPLELAEHQRVRLTVEEHTASESSASQEPAETRQKELQWLAKESLLYAGEWVALDGSRLVARGPKLGVVKAQAHQAGVMHPFFASIANDELPFAGW